MMNPGFSIVDLKFQSIWSIESWNVVEYEPMANRKCAHVHYITLPSVLLFGLG
jgi:hypothetical protein